MTPLAARLAAEGLEDPDRQAELALGFFAALLSVPLDEPAKITPDGPQEEADDRRRAA